MDPNLFHLDWDRLFEVLAAIVVLSFIMERALSVLFEHRVFVSRFNRKGLKEPIAFAVALIVCVQWRFDAVSMILLQERTRLLGELITAGVIAGGSKGSMELFRNVLNWKSTAVREDEVRRKTQESNSSGGQP